MACRWRDFEAGDFFLLGHSLQMHPIEYLIPWSPELVDVSLLAKSRLLGLVACSTCSTSLASKK